MATQGQQEAALLVKMPERHLRSEEGWRVGQWSPAAWEAPWRAMKVVQLSTPGVPTASRTRSSAEWEQVRERRDGVGGNHKGWPKEKGQGRRHPQGSIRAGPR